MTPDDDARWDAMFDFVDEDVQWEQDNLFVADRYMEDYTS